MWTWHLDFLPETTTVASELVSVNPGDFRRVGSGLDIPRVKLLCRECSSSAPQGTTR